MSINVQVMLQMYILLTGNLSCLSCVRRKQQIKEPRAYCFSMSPTEFMDYTPFGTVFLHASKPGCWFQANPVLKWPAKWHPRQYCTVFLWNFHMCAQTLVLRLILITCPTSMWFCTCLLVFQQKYSEEWSKVPFYTLPPPNYCLSLSERCLFWIYHSVQRWEKGTELVTCKRVGSD